MSDEIKSENPLLVIVRDTLAKKTRNSSEDMRQSWPLVKSEKMDLRSSSVSVSPPYFLACAWRALNGILPDPAYKDHGTDGYLPLWWLARERTC